MRSAPKKAIALAVAALLGACGGPPAVPQGPAPEYEDPRAPSWLDAAAPLPPASPPASPPSIAPSPSPDSPDAG